MNKTAYILEHISDQLDNIAQLLYLKNNSEDNQIAMAINQLGSLVIELTEEVNN